MTEDQAKKRFMLLNLVRLGAIILVALGMANIAGKILPGLSPELGYGLLIVGAVDYFLAPVILKRQWRSGDQ